VLAMTGVLSPLLAAIMMPLSSLTVVTSALRSRAFVTPDDVKAIAPDVLRHRVLTTYEAEAEEVTSDEIVQRVLAKVEAP